MQLKHFVARATWVVGLLWSGWATGQSNQFPQITIGQWREHLPWHRATFVAQSERKVYFATEWAVVEVDKAERTPRFLTRIEGLSDAGIERIGFNRLTRSLLVVYQNSNMDIWRADNGAVRNLPVIALNRQLLGDKRIYDIAFDGSFAYLACGFGVVKLNMEQGEVVYTTFTDAVVRSVALHEGYLYASTVEGFFRLPVNDANPADFGRWEALGPAQGLPLGRAAADMTSYGGQLFVGLGRALCRYNGVKLDTIGQHPEHEVIFLTAEGSGLVIGWKKGFNGNVQYLPAPFASPYDIHWACEVFDPYYAIEDGTRRFWMADGKDDFRYYDESTSKCDRFRYNSPHREAVSELAIGQGRVFAATPGNSPTLTPLYNRAGLYIREPDGQWTRLHEGTNPELVPYDCHVDLWRVAVHPFLPKFFIGSFWGGLVEATGVGQPTKTYTQYNSTLQNAGIAGANRTAIGGLAFDGSGNVWISNYSAPQTPIAVLKADGTLRHFSAPVNPLLQVAVDRNGYKWFVVGFNGGVLVYDSGANIDDPADDRYRHITTANSVLPTNAVNCIAVDQDGDVWIGTSQGAVSFQCGSNIFKDNLCRGTRRIVNVDGFNGYLLENEAVQTIAVDGGNRKWFGTTNGIFVQSPSGDEQLARFTATNSLLLDNNIRHIAIDHTTGEVWIATTKGLMSYRAEATEGSPVHSEQPYAYPNPVRPDYEGPIAIYGLARDANVKITDVAGHLVYEGRSIGGQAVWNGRDYLGRRVASGVYLVFATSTRNLDNPEGVVVKIVVLN